MSPANKIEIFRSILKSQAEDISKAASIVSFAHQQLTAIWEEQYNGSKVDPAATVYQISAMLETLDSFLLEQSTSLLVFAEA